MALAINRIHKGDCLRLFKKIPPGSVDLTFADPPFNIGYDYDVYDDTRQAADYLEWSSEWIRAVNDTLSAQGNFWLSIGDEFAAELKLIAQKSGFVCRSWVIWYYTFGVNCKRGFSRSHTHLLHFVKDPDRFTFNADNPTIRVPSARQLVYADGRANPKGRLPDNTWVLRPHDLKGGFSREEDTWYFPRVAGTFKERQGFHGCQMPEQLLGRIIRISSNPLDTVLDPFAGSGTTLAVAKKLGRQWIGFELSREYAARIRARLIAARPGDPLDGPADPLQSAPATKSGKTRKSQLCSSSSPMGRSRSPMGDTTEITRAVIDAFQVAHQGVSVDYLLAEPELNSAFVNQCARNGVPAGPAVWNRTLLKVRKRGRLAVTKATARKSLTLCEMDPFSFASEIALQQLSVDYGTTLDGILCDPELARRFDKIATHLAPGFTPFQYRWAALTIRKRAKTAKRLARTKFIDWLDHPLPRSRAIHTIGAQQSEEQVVYILQGRSRQQLYVGFTMDLRRFIEQLRGNTCWEQMELTSIRTVPNAQQSCGLQSLLIYRLGPLLNSRLLRPEMPSA